MREQMLANAYFNKIKLRVLIGHLVYMTCIFSFFALNRVLWYCVHVQWPFLHRNLCLKTDQSMPRHHRKHPLFICIYVDTSAGQKLVLLCNLSQKGLWSTSRSNACDFHSCKKSLDIMDFADLNVLIYLHS